MKTIKNVNENSPLDKIIRIEKKASTRKNTTKHKFMLTEEKEKEKEKLHENTTRKKDYYGNILKYFNNEDNIDLKKLTLLPTTKISFTDLKKQMFKPTNMFKDKLLNLSNRNSKKKYTLNSSESNSKLKIKLVTDNPNNTSHSKNR